MEQSSEPFSEVKSEVERKRKLMGEEEFLNRVEKMASEKEQKKNSSLKALSERYGEDTVKSLMEMHPLLTPEKLVEISNDLGF